MVVTESSHRRDGRHSEVIGNYNPKARGQDVELKLKLDRVDYWMGVGALPTDTARTLINRARREAAAAPAPAAEQTEA
ncbi:30S ribosomal protein S16 [Ruficoccus sp. ZRK36]|uniref:30S ribosomal protein S16 n=1 Tax=Ruficoccus sp. ZRK36 TaxID=2866311 RepID=UPI002107A56F|nr:30S ribosomal protein S16 [Ruficoccus sp. ZRK36]